MGFFQITFNLKAIRTFEILYGHLTPTLLLQDYTYKRDKRLRNGDTKWRCSKKGSTYNCKATARTIFKTGEAIQIDIFSAATIYTGGAHPTLILYGYSYKRCNVHLNGDIKWRCARKSMNCKATAKTFSESRQTLVIGVHNHDRPIRHKIFTNGKETPCNGVRRFRLQTHKSKQVRKGVLEMRIDP
ncbi:hypothetical protein evm_005197 [Chilo suppressalis]|nr:hypothetical protein evm_005197 [Chilo suppressalis]